MRIGGNGVLQSPEGALREMRDRLVLVNAAISALQSYASRSGENARGKLRISETMAGSRLRPFLVIRRDGASRAQKAS